MRARRIAALSTRARRAAALVPSRCVSTCAEGSAVGAERAHFLGAKCSYTPAMRFYVPQEDDTPAIMPALRLIDDDGRVIEGADIPALEADVLRRMQQTMVSVNEFDKVFYDAQRQGRLSFYFTNRGEEACSVGSGAALADDDVIWPQYRELGASFWRGYSIEDCANQCCCNALDVTKGRQLPMHIGSPEKHLMYVKSNIGQQVPAAVGAAFALKRRGSEGGGLSGGRCSITYFGEGAASEGDIPSALNIAAVHDCPTIFFCRNNGYAISTHADEQYRSDGIAPRGLAYGMRAMRVDGNDVLAVYAATREARRIAVEEGKPALIEAMTYRIGAHSTSDDDSFYRHADSPEKGVSERAFWEARSPIIRFGRYLEARGLWSAEEEEEQRGQTRARCIQALNDAERVAKHHCRHLFTDVYDAPNWMLLQQQRQLKEHLQKYVDHYPDVSRDDVDTL